MKHSSALLAVFVNVSLTAFANPVANAKAKPFAVRADSHSTKCEPATLCVDGLQTCAYKTETEYVRWGDCYNTCNETLTRPSCTAPLTDVTDARATSSPDPVETTSDTPTPTKTNAPTTAQAVATTSKTGTSTRTDKSAEAAAQTGTIRVPAAGWKKVETAAKKWWGRGLLHFMRDAGTRI